MIETHDIEPIQNKVASSGLITIDLEQLHHPGERIAFDIKPFLFRELILKEKDFRESLKQVNWQLYSGKNVAFFCSADAIIPTWAYMLLATHAEPFVNKYIFGSVDELNRILFEDAIRSIDAKNYEGKRVIIKGCSDKEVPVSAYVELTHALLPYVKSIMYGEACSNVPIYKKKQL